MNIHIIAVSKADFTGYVDSGFRLTTDLRYAQTFQREYTAKETAALFNRFGFGTAVMQVVEVNAAA